MLPQVQGTSLTGALTQSPDEYRITPAAELNRLRRRRRFGPTVQRRRIAIPTDRSYWFSPVRELHPDSVVA